MVDLDTFDRVHAQVWAAVAEPGDWLDARTRSGVIQAARASEECGVCDARAEVAAPAMAGVEHGPRGGLSAAWVDVVHRIARDNTRLTRAFAEHASAQLGAEAYVEGIGLVASVRVMDAFRRLTDREPAPPPEPRPGEPTRVRPAGVGDVGAWVPQSLEKTRANVTRALSSVPKTDSLVWRPLVDVHYSRGAEFASLVWERALSRPQIELVAATVAHANECFY